MLREPGRPVEVEEVELDAPKADEVLVRVAAAGVCHSDVRLADGELGDGRWPMVLGHEGAGVVEAVGDGRRRTSRPAITLRSASCRRAARCRSCRAGRPNLCEPAGTNGVAGTLMDGTSRLHVERRDASARPDDGVLRGADGGRGRRRGEDPARAAAVAGGAARLRSRHGDRRGAQRRARPAGRLGLRDRLRRRRPAGDRRCAHRRSSADRRGRRTPREARACAAARRDRRRRGARRRRARRRA